MERIEYNRSRFADILQISESKLDALDRKRQPDQSSIRSYGPADLSAYRQALGNRPKRLPCRRQLFLNFKGGTGKTSLSTAYAFCLAEKGYQVLMVDLDSQGHAAKCLGYEAEEVDHTLYEVLVKRMPLQEVLLPCPLKEIDLVPSNLRMSTIDLALMPLHSREFRLQQAFESLKKNYDYIIMDAPPSFGLLNLNALVATHDLFVPVLADFLSFHGLKLLFETVTDLENDLQLCLERIHVVINHYNPTTRIARQARSALEEHYQDYLLKTVVRQCTKFAQASSEGLPISAFDPSSKAACDIEALIDEVCRKRTESSNSEELQHEELI